MHSRILIGTEPHCFLALARFGFCIAFPSFSSHQSHTRRRYCLSVSISFAFAKQGNSNIETVISNYILSRFSALNTPTKHFTWEQENEQFFWFKNINHVTCVRIICTSYGVLLYSVVHWSSILFAEVESFCSVAINTGHLCVALKILCKH